MAYRGYFALNGVEFANSARVVSHLGAETPTSDFGFFSDYSPDSYSMTEDGVSGLYTPQPPCGDEDPPGSGLYGTGTLVGGGGLFYPEWNGCSPIEVSAGLFEIPDSSVEVSAGLWSPPDGSRQITRGLFEVDECYSPPTLCSSCKTIVTYDDSWLGQRAFLGDSQYRPELAPWYSTLTPESGEFGGVWVLDVDGLDVTPIERPITPTVGDGAIAGPLRCAARTVTFTALLVACSHAGVTFGLQWLTCLLRATDGDTDHLLRYLAASPSGSGVDPTGLWREAHNVVLTKAPDVTQRINSLGPNRQANMYQITWEMTVLSPFAYFPQVNIDVDWDQITRQPVNWIHAADCAKPDDCSSMPVMFSADCVPETITKVYTPPPVCGGCMPVSAIDKYSFQVPTMDTAFTCRNTAVTTVITNTGESPLTLQAFWRVCGEDVRCEDNQFPLQIAGLPAAAELHLDGITGRYKAWYDERWRTPVGVVGTPNGAPWQPPVIDRTTCWEFIVQTASSSEFTVSLALADREA